MTETPPFQKIGRHLVEEERGLEETEQKLKDALNRMEEFRQFIHQWRQEKDEHATWTEEFMRQLENFAGAVHEVDEADEELHQILDDAGTTKEAMKNLHQG